MGDIKSAREIALEKIDKIGEPTEEERLEWKYLPEGEKLAARYLRHEAELQPEIAKFDKKGAPYVARGVTSILIKNILLPKDETEKKANKIAMDGIKAVKTDKKHVEAILNQIQQIFEHYNTQGEAQRKQAYAALKVDFQNKVDMALRQQGSGMDSSRIDIEKQPQFQEEWRKLKIRMDGQYLQVLGDYKQELEALS